jgi:hypothetical protein
MFVLASFSFCLFCRKVIGCADFSGRTRAAGSLNSPKSWRLPSVGYG